MLGADQHAAVGDRVLLLVEAKRPSRQNPFPASKLTHASLLENARGVALFYFRVQLLEALHDVVLIVLVFSSLTSRASRHIIGSSSCERQPDASS